MRDASGDAEGRRNCARAVGHIARHSEGARARLCAAGAIDVLAACLADADAPMDTRAAAAEALDNLARGAAPQGDEVRGVRACVGVGARGWRFGCARIAYVSLRLTKGRSAHHTPAHTH